LKVYLRAPKKLGPCNFDKHYILDNTTELLIQLKKVHPKAPKKLGRYNFDKHFTYKLQKIKLFTIQIVHVFNEHVNHELI
jgi:hypothetical protein